MASEVTATNVRRQFHKILEVAEAGGRVVITRHGKPIAAFIGVKEFEQACTPDASPEALPAMDVTPVDANGTPVAE